MFKFLQSRREAKAAEAANAVVAECDAVLQRNAGAMWQFVTVPRDIAEREAMLQRASAAGLSDNATVLQLAFLHRLLAVMPVASETSAAAKDALLDEATRLDFDSCAVRELAAMRELQRFVEQGPRMIERDSKGRAVFLRCEAEFKNKPGQLEVHDDGVRFVGEVVVDVPWVNVVHAAVTTHTYQGVDYVAVALQEGKRRTPTKLVFPLDYSADLRAALTVAVWQESQQRAQG